MAGGDTSPVLVDINLETFAAHATTERFFGACATIDARVTRRLVFVLSSLPPTLPKTRLQNYINRMRPFCRGVGYRVEDIAALVQIDLPNSYNPIVVVPSAACHIHTPNTVRELFNSLQTAKTRILISGVASEQDAALYRSLGADMVSMER